MIKIQTYHGLILCLATMMTLKQAYALPMRRNTHLDGMPAQVRLIHDPINARAKRDMTWNILPRQLSFDVTSPSETNVRLQLVREAPLLPTYTSRGRVTQAILDAAVYIDKSKLSAMIVKHDGANYTLRGSFNHGGKEWDILPKRENMPFDFGNHRIILSHLPTNTMNLNGVIKIPNKVKIHENKPYYYNHQTRQHERLKRSATQHVIEINFIVDYRDYSQFVNIYPDDAMNEVTLWYTYVAEGLRLRYETVQTIAVTTRVTHLLVLQTSAESSFIEDLRGSGGEVPPQQVLNSIKSWAEGQGNALPSADHVMVFTGNDVENVAGAAFSSGVCRDNSYSINENTLLASTSWIAAHELGHCLSAIHDVDTSCSDQTSHIMAVGLNVPFDAADEGNPWRFSTCSQDDIKAYLESVSCTISESRLPTILPAKAWGQVASRDEQCFKFAQGNSKYCQLLQQNVGAGEEDLCSAMYCSNGDNVFSCNVMLPLDYTECGINKWCLLGECVSSTTTTITTRTATTAATSTALITTTTSNTRSTTGATSSPTTIFTTHTTTSSTTTNPSMSTQTTTKLTMKTAAPTSSVTTTTEKPSNYRDCLPYLLQERNLSKFASCLREIFHSKRGNLIPNNSKRKNNTKANNEKIIKAKKKKETWIKSTRIKEKVTKTKEKKANKNKEKEIKPKEKKGKVMKIKQKKRKTRLIKVKRKE